MKNTLTLIPLIICFCLLSGYNFMNAAWSAPTGAPPNNNTEAPVNVGTVSQTKNGRLNLYGGGTTTPVSTLLLRTNGSVMANIFAAGGQMRSDEYCDSVGNNCVAATDLGGASNSWGTWTNVTSSRVGNVWYRNNNTTGRVVHYQSNYQAPYVYVSPNGSAINQVQVAAPDGSSGEWGPGFFIVPPGHYYKIATAASFHYVSELQLPF